MLARRRPPSATELQNSDEKSVLVKVVVSFKNGTKRTESVKLVKKDGKWKVSL